jgi:hypothetical protein
MIGSFKKDQAAVRTYSIDWSRWRFPPGCHIASSSWKVVPHDDGTLALVESSIYQRVWTCVRVSGGVPGRTYTLQNHIISSDPRTPPEQDTRNIQIYIKAPQDSP